MTISKLHAGLVTGALALAVVTGLALAGGGFGGGALGIATAIVWLALVLTILAGLLPTERPSPGLVAGAGCLLGLLGLTILSLQWTTSDELAFESAVRLAGYLGVFLLAGLLARRDRIGPALMGLAAAGVVVALVALGSRLLGIGPGDADLVADLPTAAGRLSFPIGYWNALGALMALSLPPLCWQAARSSLSSRRAGLALAGFPPLVLAAYLTSSRGAVLAIVIGLAVTVGCSTERRRTAAAASIGLALSAPAVIIATLAAGLIDTPGDGTPGRAELATLATLLGAAAFAILLGGRLIGPISRSRPFGIRVPVRAVVATAIAAAAVVVIAIGPSALIGDLRAGTDAQTSAGNDRATGIFSASGSGRAQFWEAAIDAFADEPIRGVGAGAYGDYWNEHGGLSTPARNAHSAPLEVLAELGLVGFVLFAGFIFVVLLGAIGRVRAVVDESEGAGAALGLIVAGLLSFAIDWTWQVPAVVVPVMVAGGMSAALSVRSRYLARVPAVSGPAVAVAALFVAVPAVWASAVLGLSTARLDDSAEALEAGRLNDAAAAARSAASIQPWASEPWIQLGIIEQAGGNYNASFAAAREAIDRNGSNLRAWSLATSAQGQRGNFDGSFAYGERTAVLSPAQPSE